MTFNQPWRVFLEGTLYVSATPWQDDPAFGIISNQPGLRDSIGGPVAPALTMACNLVQAIRHFDIEAYVEANRPAQGLCLGIGMNTLEPYDLLHALELDRVHACDWIGEHLVESAKTLQSLHDSEPALTEQIRLHQASISDLSFLPNASIHIVYTANVFTWEVPMMQATFDLGIQEILRVLADDGIVFSKGSAGELEKRLSSHGTMLLPHPPVTVFQKKETLSRSNCP